MAKMSSGGTKKSGVTAGAKKVSAKPSDMHKTGARKGVGTKSGMTHKPVKKG